jgi:hypothetical protein
VYDHFTMCNEECAVIELLFGEATEQVDLGWSAGQRRRQLGPPLASDRPPRADEVMRSDGKNGEMVIRGIYGLLDDPRLRGIYRT